MGIEKVRVGVSGESFDEHFVGVIAVEKPRPKVDLPGFAPTGATIAAKDQRLFGRGAGLLSALLLAVSTCSVVYSQEARGYSWLLLGTILGMTILYLAPPMLVASGRFVPMILGGVAWALMSLTYCDLVLYYKLPAWRALTLPAAALFYLGATVHSAIKYWSGTGGEWKGRSQDAGRANDH